MNDLKMGKFFYSWALFGSLPVRVYPFAPMDGIWVNSVYLCCFGCKTEQVMLLFRKQQNFQDL